MDFEHIISNEFGLFIHAIRKAKGYTMEEISRGICSIPTLSRIEAGEKMVDYIVIETLLERMSVASFEYEFVLDNDDYALYHARQNIRCFMEKKDSAKAENALAQYEKQKGTHKLHRQFLQLQKATVEQAKGQRNPSQLKKEFSTALAITTPNYPQVIESHGFFSDIELFGILGLIRCIKEKQEKEKELEKLYQYFQWYHIRERLFPTPYRSLMQEYAQCLYELEQYEKCRKLCEELLEELYETSKLENRYEIFALCAMAKRKLGLPKEQWIRDWNIAYSLAEFYEDNEAIERFQKLGMGGLCIK